MNYVITFMKKSGKVKGKIGCLSEKTAEYIVNQWLEDEETKGICIVYDVETQTEKAYKKNKKNIDKI